MSLQVIGVLLKKLIRYKSTYIMLFVIPVLAVMLAVLFNSVSSVQTSIIVTDLDHSEISNQIIHKLKENDKFKLIEQASQKEGRKQVKEGRAEIQIIIPKSFMASLVKRREIQPILLVSPKESEIENWVEEQLFVSLQNIDYLAAISNENMQHLTKLIQLKNEKKLTVQRKELVDIKNKKIISNQSLGFLLIIILSGMSFISTNIIRDKESNIISRIKIASNGIGGYLISYFLIGLFVCLIQVVMMLMLLSVLGIHFSMEFSWLCLVLLCYSSFVVCLGIFIGVHADSLLSNEQITNIILLPTSMLAGCLWPSTIMPVFMQKIGHIFPQNWVLTMINNYQINQNLFVNNCLYVLFIASIIVLYYFSYRSLNKVS